MFHIATVVILVNDLLSGSVVLFELSNEYSVVTDGDDTNAQKVLDWLTGSSVVSINDSVVDTDSKLRCHPEYR